MADSGATTMVRLSPVRGGIIALALTTAIVRIVLAIPLTMVGFYLNGLGYIALATALYLPVLARYRRQVRWLLMGYTALTILLWAVIGRPYTTIGYVDKAVELVLLGLLWLDGRRPAESEESPRLADAAQ